MHPEVYFHYTAYPDWHCVRKHYGMRTNKYKLIKFYGDDIHDYEFYDLYNQVTYIHKTAISHYMFNDNKGIFT